MFIQTEDTPNPATMKFLPNMAVMPSGTLEVTDARAADASPLAESLFKIDGVKSVFLAREFITVTKQADKDWSLLKPSLLAAIMDHFASGMPVLSSTHMAEPAASEDEGEVVKQIRELLDVKIRPAVAQDGGDITFQKYEDGVLYLNMKGSCAGCPSSTMTLKAGIENMMKHYIPEVREVRQSFGEA